MGGESPAHARLRPHASTRHHVFDEFSVADDKDSSDQHVRDSFGVLRGIIEGGAVYDPLGVQHRDIRVGSDLQPVLGLNPEPLGGHQAHFPKRVHQCERLLLADIAAQHARKRAGGPWVTFAVFEDSIAGNHH